MCHRVARRFRVPPDERLRPRPTRRSRAAFAMLYLVGHTCRHRLPSSSAISGSTSQSFRKRASSRSWSCILIFWPILVLFVRSGTNSSASSTLAHAHVKVPAFWLLLVISVHAIYPWVLLRKVPVIKVEHLSNRAVRLYFLPKESIRPLHGVSISDAPLHEWHSFAAISNTDGGAASCIISKGWRLDSKNCGPSCSILLHA